MTPKNRNLTKKLLEEASIRVPRGRAAHSLEEALEIQEEISNPLVVMPLEGNDGLGISKFVSTVPEMKAAFHLARIQSDIVMIEECLKGKLYRILIVCGKMMAAWERALSGIGVDITGEVHPDIQLMCEKAASIIGHDICGVDLLAEDIRLPMTSQMGGIINMNAIIY